MEIRDAYSKLCDNGLLREENKNFEWKGLTHTLDFPQMFKDWMDSNYYEPHTWGHVLGRRHTSHD